MAEQLKRKRRQDGFTLIEIIAVLVILGILAIVAVPKYFDMQNEARKQAAQGLVAAALSQLSMGYASYKLNPDYTGTPSSECEKVQVSGSTSEGTVTCTGDAKTDWEGTSTITATVDKQTATATWTSPESEG